MVKGEQLAVEQRGVMAAWATSLRGIVRQAGAALDAIGASDTAALAAAASWPAAPTADEIQVEAASTSLQATDVTTLKQAADAERRELARQV